MGNAARALLCPMARPTGARRAAGTAFFVFKCMIVHVFVPIRLRIIIIIIFFTIIINILYCVHCISLMPRIPHATHRQTAPPRTNVGRIQKRKT